jgi:hypothetical protein
MTTAPDPVESYRVLFTALDAAKESLKGDSCTQLNESNQLAEEIQALRMIVEQVTAESTGVQSLTLG